MKERCCRSTDSLSVHQALPLHNYSRSISISTIWRGTITPALMRPWIYKNTLHKCYEIEGICVLIKALCVSSPQGFSFMNDWNSGVKFKAYTPPSLIQNSAERWLVSAGACLCLNISAFTDRRDVVRDLVSWSAAWRASRRLTERERDEETLNHYTSGLITDARNTETGTRKRYNL